MKNFKNFLVTGGAGFIGSEIVKQLLDKGYNVRIVDNLSKKTAPVDRRAELIRLDLTDANQIKTVFKGADIVINAVAKIGGIGYFHKFPATILSENNKLYSSTFEAAVEARIKRMVYISSSMVYESTKKFPSKEEDMNRIPPPISAYGFSKLSGEWYCQAFWDQYGLPFSIVRPFNAYGINEFPEEEVGWAHVIPDLIRKILDGQYPLKILGDGKQTRCFTHVSDLANGIIAVALHPQGQNQIFNIASRQEISMLNLAKKLWELMDIKKPFQVNFMPGFKYDIKRRVPDTQKIRKIIEWEDRIKLDDGLKEVVLWLQNQLQ